MKVTKFSGPGDPVVYILYRPFCVTVSIQSLFGWPDLVYLSKFEGLLRNRVRIPRLLSFGLTVPTTFHEFFYIYTVSIYRDYLADDMTCRIAALGNKIWINSQFIQGAVYHNFNKFQTQVTHRRKQWPTEEQTDGLKDRRTDWRKDRRTEGQTDGLKERWTDWRTDGRPEGQKDGLKDRRMDWRTDGWTEGQTDGLKDRRTDGTS